MEQIRLSEKEKLVPFSDVDCIFFSVEENPRVEGSNEPNQIENPTFGEPHQVRKTFQIPKIFSFFAFKAF